MQTPHETAIDNANNLINSLGCLTDHWIDPQLDLAISVYDNAEDISPLYDTSDNLDYFFRNDLFAIGGANCNLSLEDIFDDGLDNNVLTNQPVHYGNAFITFIGFDKIYNQFFIIDKNHTVPNFDTKNSKVFVAGKVIAYTENESEEDLQQLIKADISMLNNFLNHQVYDIYVIKASTGQTLNDGLLESVYPDINKTYLSKEQIINLVNNALKFSKKLKTTDFVPAKFRLISEPIKK